ncbi:MAG: ACP S-malonyltransferase [Firmicutes bacterium]|nr:ACP S-malonyltransferase [Bacillota bacterium]
MGKIAWVFPGQGSQYLGMGRSIAEAEPKTKALLDTAGKRLGYDLAELCWQGPEVKLRQTQYTQPALLTVSTMLAQVLRSRGLKPDVVAGHSLGEYSALVACGSLEFEAGVTLVARRGQLMEEAVPDGQGAMAVLLGLDYSQVEAICQQASQGEIVEPANLNCPGQIVISGERRAVQRAMVLGKDRGARRVLELGVSGPFHSSLMRPAARVFVEDLAKIDLQDPEVPLAANVTADYVQDANAIRTVLVQQLYSPVRWEETIRRLLADGVQTFVEVGPGNVLAGLIKRVSREVDIVGFQEMEGLEKVLEMAKGDIVI